MTEATHTGIPSASPGASPASRLTRNILLGMLAGLATGLLINVIALPAPLVAALVDGVFKVGGSLFLAGLKLLVVPLVFVSLVCGTAALDDVAKLGRVGLRTLTLYLLTTAVAVTMALATATLLEPGIGFALKTNSTFTPVPVPGLADTIIALIPSNPIRAMADGQMLQIIVFASLLGVALTLAGEAGSRIVAIARDLDTVIMRLVDIVMLAAPIGVFCLVSRVFATQGFDALAPLLRYFLCVSLALLAHAVITYGTVVKVFARRSPLQFLRAVRPILVVAFGTSSSNATIPVSLETAEERLGIPSSIASFTIPLGATINMDGTAIMQGVATAFIAQAYGIELGVHAWVTVVLTATLASVGTAGVPGVGLITLAMVLRQVGLPVEGIGLIMGVDRLLDMMRTAVNVCGDVAVTCAVAHQEKDHLAARTTDGN